MSSKSALARAYVKPDVPGGKEKERARQSFVKQKAVKKVKDTGVTDLHLNVPIHGRNRQVDFNVGHNCLDEPASLQSAILLSEQAFAVVERVSDEDRHAFARLVKLKLEDLENREGNELPPLDDTGKSYPLYPGRVDALEWLEKYWGEYLAYFSEGRNVLFQDELRKRDPSLMAALTSQVGYRNRKGTMKIKVRDIVPPRSARVDKITEGISEEDLKEMTRLVKAKRERLKRKLDS
ncbi:hypothetical protein [Rhabdochromatium marinum]|uniref:hypothetical protein n=1 Tax=Rhabdochromatium marinum TaxID=48729 RepID=UPI001905502E|nr:hypothetical protein [Rhabdochromatium marinum]MBK1650457.1 hypothetical protein [Rhabdochromatium marinum]